MASLTHLARRGATYVWRRTLPKAFAGFRKIPDYRISTRSPHLREAARRARRLDVAFDAIVESVGIMMASGLTLSFEDVNGIVRAALQRVLDEAEAARAIAGPRSAEDARTAAAAHGARRTALRRALVTNDLGALPTLWPAAAALLTDRAPQDAALLGRALLRALERACLIEAAREDGAYDDDILHWLPYPSAAPVTTLAASCNPAYALPTTLASTRSDPLLGSGAPPAPTVPFCAPVAAPPPGRSGVSAMATHAPAAAASLMPASAPTLAESSAVVPEKPVAMTTPSTPMTPGGLRVSDLLDGFLLHLTGRVHPETIVDYRQSVGLFIELAGDRPVAGVRLDHVLEFRDHLRKLPAKYGQRREFKGKPLREAIAIADVLDDSVGQRVDESIARGETPAANRMYAVGEARVPRLSMKAANKHLTGLKAFFDYASSAGHTTGDNPIAKAFYAKKLTGKKAKDERESWQPDAVRAVLLSPAWTGCRSAAERAEPGPNIIQDDFYWAWLVLTHHPLRLEEACQLMVRNIVRKDGVWCLHIAEDEQGNQQLKTENATRLVPIHRLLLEAGFLSRVEQLRREGVRALFPSFQPTTASRAKQLTENVSIDVRQRFGRQFYKKIVAYLQDLDQHQEGRVNHSLRHTIDTMLHNEDVASVRIAELLGHQRMTGGETTNRYYKGATLAKLKEAVDRIDYGVAVDADGRLTIHIEAENRNTVVRLERRH